MKTLTLAVGLFFVFGKTLGQNIGINHNGESPYPSAILDIKSATKGLLIPRHSTASKLAIASPDSGLIVLDTTIWCLSFYNGASWVDICTQQTTPTCPPGFARVPGRNYCIEVNERLQMDWDGATTTCLSLGYRLCHLGEWRDACFNQAITEDNLGNVVPLQNMTGYEEWTWNITPNTTVPTAGAVSCGNITISTMYTNYPFRCCRAFF